MTLAVSEKPPWWRRWIVAPVAAQLTAGITPEKLSWSVALGAVLGIFPVMGTTTLLCLLIGWACKLNQVVLQIAKELVYPAHLALILVFIRLGERLHGVPEIPFSIPQLMGRFKDSPLQFARDFGLAAWHGVVAWLVIAPFAVILIRWAVLPGLRRLARTLQERKEARP